MTLPERKHDDEPYSTAAAVQIFGSIVGAVLLFSVRLGLSQYQDPSALLNWKLVVMDVLVLVAIILAAWPVYKTEPDTFMSRQSWSRVFLLFGSMATALLVVDVWAALR